VFIFHIILENINIQTYVYYVYVLYIYIYFAPIYKIFNLGKVLERGLEGRNYIYSCLI